MNETPQHGYWEEPDKVPAAVMDRELQPGPIEAERMAEIVMIARRIMFAENARTDSWIGTNIWTANNRLYYSFHESRRYYIELATAIQAEHFLSVLRGLLALSKTRFTLEEERDPSTLPETSLGLYDPRPYIPFPHTRSL